MSVLKVLHCKIIYIGCSRISAEIYNKEQEEKTLMKNKIILIFALFLVSPWAQAAEMVAWKSYLAIVMGIALVAGTVLSLRNKKAESRVSKILLAGLYFWVITFAELIILALVYHFTH